jgi:putative FmdB family regulatory protein
MEVMPLYTFTCMECDESHELMLKIEERDNAICPGCGIRLIRNIDSPGMVWAPTRGKSGFAT